MQASGKVGVAVVAAGGHQKKETVFQGVHTNYFQNSSFYSPKSSIIPGFRIEKGTFFQSKW